MQQQVFLVPSPSGMNTNGVGNMQANVIYTNGTLSPQGNYFGPSQAQASTSQWQTTQQVPTHQYVASSGFANTRQPMNNQHGSTQVLGMYPVNQEYNPSSNGVAVSWTKETNYSAQVAQECIASVMNHGNTRPNPQQMMNIENMQNPTCFINGPGNVVEIPNQMTQIQSAPLIQQHARPKAIEGKNVWPPKFDSRLPTQPVQCQQSMQHMQVQNQYGTQMQSPLQNQFVQHQLPVRSPQPEQWQHNGLMQQPMLIHKPVHQQQFVQPQNSMQQRADQQQSVQNQQLLQQQKQSMLQVSQPVQQQVQQQFFSNQQSVQLQNQQSVQLQNQQSVQLQNQQSVQLQNQQSVQLQNQQSVQLQQRSLQYQQPVQLQHQMQATHGLQMQNPQLVAYNSENRQNQFLASDRRSEIYIGAHQPRNSTIENLSRTANETTLTGNGYSLSDITHVAKPLDDALMQPNTIASYEQHKTGTIQHLYQNEQFTNGAQEHSLQVQDKIQMQATTPANGHVRAKELVKESGVAPAHSVVDLTESEVDVKGKELQEMYIQILKTKHHFLHQVRKFKEKRSAYHSTKNQQLQNRQSCKSSAVSQKANEITVTTGGTQLAKNPQGQLCNQNLIMQNTKAINDPVQSTRISSDHMPNLENIQQVNTSPTLASPPPSHLRSDAANLTNQSINCPEGHYLQATTTKNYSAVCNPQKDKADLLVTQERAAIPPKQISHQRTLPSVPSAGGSDLQSNAQEAKLPERPRSKNARKSPLLLDLLLEQIEKSSPSLNDANVEATRNGLKLPSCNTQAVTASTDNNLTDSSVKEEGLNVPKELERSFFQVNEAEEEILESCFNLWKKSPSNIAAQIAQEPNPCLDTKGTTTPPGLCDQNGTVEPEINSQSSLSNKTVAVVSPLVLSVSEGPNNAAVSESQILEMVRLEGTLGHLLEQNIQSTMVDSSSMPDIGVKTKRNSPLPTNGCNVSDESGVKRSSEIASVVSSSSYDKGHQSKPGQGLDVVKKVESNPVENIEAVSSQTNVSFQSGSTLNHHDAWVRDITGILEGVLDEQLLISGICTLVEGNLSYNPQIAKIFDRSSLAEGERSKNLLEASPLQPTVKPLAVGDVQLSTEVQNSKDSADPDKQQGDITISQAKAAPLTDDLSNLNPSVPTSDSQVLVIGTKHKHGRKQITNKFQTTTAHNKKSEFKHSFYATEDVSSASKEKVAEEVVTVTNKQIKEEDQLMESLDAGSSTNECHIPDAHAHFKADHIGTNDNLLETLPKQSDNDTSSIKETVVEQVATSDNYPTVGENASNAEGQLEKIDNSALSEANAHNKATLFMDYQTHVENEPASGVSSTQGLRDQLSELLLEFPYGLDRREHVRSLEVPGVDNKDSDKCNFIERQDPQVATECNNIVQNCGPEKESCVNQVREKDDVSDLNLSVHGCEQRVLSIEKCDPTLQRNTNYRESSQSISGELKADCLKSVLLKVDIKQEKESSDSFSCVKTEWQYPEPCSLMGGIQGLGTLNSSSKNLAKNTINKNVTMSPLQSSQSLKETSSFTKCKVEEQENKLQLSENCSDVSKNVPACGKVDSLRIGSVKVEIKMEKQEQPESQNCIKQETQQHKPSSRSGMHGSMNGGLQRSDCTTQSRADENRSTSPEAKASAAEAPVKDSRAKCSATEQPSTLLLGKQPKCPFQNPSSAAGSGFPNKNLEKVEIKKEKQEPEVNDCVKQETPSLKPCSLTVGANVTALQDIVNRSTEKRDCTAQKRVEDNGNNSSGSSQNFSSGKKAESLNKGSDKMAAIGERREDQKCITPDSQCSEERKLACGIQSSDEQLSVGRSLEKIHCSETIEVGLLKCQTAGQQSEMQRSSVGSGVTTSVPGVTKKSSPDEGSHSPEISGKIMVGETENFRKLSGPVQETLVCPENKESCVTEVETTCNLNEKSKSSSPIVPSSAKSIIADINQSCPVGQEESQRDDECRVSLPSIDDSENDWSMNQIKITILDSENMSKLFPPTVIDSVSEAKTSHTQNGVQLSAGPIANDVYTPHKLKGTGKHESSGIVKEHQSSDGKTCCLYKWVHSLYSYGPKCMCINNEVKDGQKSDSYQKSSNCKEVDAAKAVNSPCSMDESLKENVHCRKKSKERNLSLKGKSVKRPKPPTLDGDCKRLKTASPTEVERKRSEHKHTVKSDLCKKKSKYEKQRKHKTEKEGKASKLKTQPGGGSQVILATKLNSCVKDPIKNILPDKKSPEVGQNSSKKLSPTAKTEHGKGEERHKEKSDQKHILKSELKKSKTELKLKNVVSSSDNKGDKAKGLVPKNIGAEGSKSHSEKSEKRKHKHHEKKSKVSTGNSSSKEERKHPNTETKTKVLAEKYASNQEVPAKKQFEAEKACTKNETLPQNVPLQDTGKKALSDSENQDADAAADKKRKLTVQEYQQRQKAEHLKAVKRNLAVHEAREAMNVHKTSFPNHTYSHSKPETAKSNSAPFNRSCAEGNTSKCAESMTNKRLVHDAIKRNPLDSASSKPHDSSSKDKQTKHDFAHSNSTSKHSIVDQQITKKMSFANKDANETHKVSGTFKNAKESSLCHPEKAAVTNTTHQAIHPKNVHLDESVRKEQWNRAFRPTLENKEVSVSRNGLVDPRLQKFRLGPDGQLRRHSTDGRSLTGNRPTSSEKCPVQGIKSRNEDCYSSSAKKRKFEYNVPEQPTATVFPPRTPSSTYNQQQREERLAPEFATPKQGSSPTERQTLEKGASMHRPNLGSKATFDAFKQRFLDSRSKSVDGASVK